mgnify:FL=1
MKKDLRLLETFNRLADKFENEMNDQLQKAAEEMARSVEEDRLI